MFKVEYVSSTNGLKIMHTYNLFKFFIFYMYNKETSSWDFFLNFMLMNKTTSIKHIQMGCLI